MTFIPVTSVLLLAGCFASDPSLNELQALCAAGNKEACKEREAILALPATPADNVPPEGSYVSGSGENLNCSQGFEGEVNCVKY